MDFLEALAGPNVRRHRAGEELFGFERARAAARAQQHARPQHLRDKRQLGARIGVRETAADRAAISRLNVTHPRERLAKQRHARGERVVALDRALACASAGARHVLFDCDEFQLGDFVDIDQPRRAHEPHRHHRHKALAAGEELRAVAVRREQRANLGKRSGAGVFERSGLQGAIPGVRPYDKARTRRPRALCTALRLARSEAEGSDGNQADAASGDVRHEKAARTLWRVAGLRPLSIRPSDREARQDRRADC